MIRALALDAFKLALRAPLLWLLALLAGETGLAVILFPPQSLNLPGPSPTLPALALPLALSLLALLLMLWLFSVLAFNALILAIASAADHLPLHAPWAAARPHFWPVLTLRFFYLLALAGLFWLLTANAASPWAWLASALLSALAGLLLNLSTRAILLDPHPLSALRALLGQPWPLFKVWIGSQVLSMLTLLSFLLMILVLEVITLIVFYAFGSHLEDPYYGLLLVVLGVFVAIPTFFFVAVAGAFINSYWTLAYLRLRP